MASVLIAFPGLATMGASATVKPADHAARRVAPYGWPQRSARVRALRAHTRPRAGLPPPHHLLGRVLAAIE